MGCMQECTHCSLLAVSQDLITTYSSDQPVSAWHKITQVSGSGKNHEEAGGSRHLHLAVKSTMR